MTYTPRDLTIVQLGAWLNVMHTDECNAAAHVVNAARRDKVNAGDHSAGPDPVCQCDFDDRIQVALVPRMHASPEAFCRWPVMMKERR